MNSFITFLESIKTLSNQHQIYAFQEAYSVLLEMPHSETMSGDIIDLHVEDVMSKLGRVETLKYVNTLIDELEHDKPMDMLYTLPDQLSHLDHPQTTLSPDRQVDLLNRLKLIRDNII